MGKINIYRILFFILLGIILGFASGVYITTKTILNNIPPSQEISIGKMKLKGRGNILDADLSNKMPIEKKRKKK